MLKSVLRQTIIDQQKILDFQQQYVPRDIALESILQSEEIVVLSGIRRCGKSTILTRLSKIVDSEFLYINFDDIRFSDFSQENFQHIYEIIGELFGSDALVILLLDEIQNIPGWERWLNNLHTFKIKTIVTGSNASVLSSELSTYLTGRHKTIRIHPLSFREYLRHYSIAVANPEFISSTQKGEIIRYLRKYLEEGGFPAVIRSGDISLSEQYLTDIIYRDIVSRFGIREIKELKDLTVYLISNAGRMISYKTLAEITGLKSVSTIKNYLDYLEHAFLLFRIAPLHYSLKGTSRASHKIYAGDLSFIQSAGFHLTEDLGQRIENLIFLELLRRYQEIYFYSGSGGCDFLVKRNQVVEEAIQVSYSLNDQKTPDREVKGLVEAMKRFNVKKGLILTFEDEELFDISNIGISVVPIWKWLLTVP